MEIGLGVRGENWDAKISHGSNMAGGASLKTWYEYFPNARIVGLDINDAKFLENDRTTTHQVDQGDRNQLAELRKIYPDESFDLIIDDGSHRADHQQTSLELLYPLLKSGGYYIIEDLNDLGILKPGSGRHSSPETIATRDFFYRYAETGMIADHHAFKSVEFLKSVSDVSFHSPAPFLRVRDWMIEAVRLLLGRAHRGLLRREFNRRSHRIVVLTKSA